MFLVRYLLTYYYITFLQSSAFLLVGWGFLFLLNILWWFFSFFSFYLGLGNEIEGITWVTFHRTIGIADRACKQSHSLITGLLFLAWGVGMTFRVMRETTRAAWDFLGNMSSGCWSPQAPLWGYLWHPKPSTPPLKLMHLMSGMGGGGQDPLWTLHLVTYQILPQISAPVSSDMVIPTHHRAECVYHHGIQLLQHNTKERQKLWSVFSTFVEVCSMGTGPFLSLSFVRPCHLCIVWRVYSPGLG